MEESDDLLRSLELGDSVLSLTDLDLDLDIDLPTELILDLDLDLVILLSLLGLLLLLLTLSLLLELIFLCRSLEVALPDAAWISSFWLPLDLLFSSGSG